MRRRVQPKYVLFVPSCGRPPESEFLSEPGRSLLVEYFHVRVHNASYFTDEIHSILKDVIKKKDNWLVTKTRVTYSPKTIIIVNGVTRLHFRLAPWLRFTDRATDRVSFTSRL